MKKGSKHTPEAIARMQKACMGRIPTDQTLAKLRQPRAYRSKGPGIAARNYVVLHYKSSARRRDLEFRLTDGEMLTLLTGACHYCGGPPSRDVNVKARHGSYGTFICNGIDRKDNSKGYTLDNRVSCCWLCNRNKGGMDYQNFLAWIVCIYTNRRRECNECF